ncbi:hypothetical protein [Pseudomonas sp. dw_358]|uniref:hypothetical protein n=1 Tax=Pseudomonas sp. dw_358 TaxID=2720083 RepID=UPI001BD4651D|nr:hypothetical protein [Pseudomonas sp. dw_358]
MRFYQVATLTLALAASVPAFAGKWPDGAKERFTQDCVNSASQHVDPAMAKQLCDCSTAQATKDFSDKELAMLNTPPSNANEEVRARLMKDTQVCRTKS